MVESRQSQPPRGLKAALVRLILWPPVGDLAASCAKLASRFSPSRVADLLRRVADRIEFWNLQKSSTPSIEPVSISPRSLPTLLLFHTLPWSGGNWEYTRQLIVDLDFLNRRQKRCQLKVVLHPEQRGIDELRQRAPGTQFLSGKPIRLRSAMTGKWECAFDSTVRSEMLQADVWISLSDRFAYPLQVERPLIVVIHDVIQSLVPESFSAAFHLWRTRGMEPTVAAARRVIVGSQATANDARAEYEIPLERITVIPVACEPHRRFDGILPRKPVALQSPDSRPMILCVANASPHKGHELLFDAFAILKRQLGADSPLLVCCGGDTDGFSHRRDKGDHPYWRQIREKLESQQLQEGRDIEFLDYVADDGLRWLFENATLVVNSARYDNGTYCVVEATFFGKPVVSTRYPAAEELAKRFSVVCEWAEMGNPHSLADALARVLSRKKKPSGASSQVSKSQNDLEHSTVTYAERLLEVGVNLAASS